MGIISHSPFLNAALATFVALLASTGAKAQVINSPVRPLITEVLQEHKGYKVPVEIPLQGDRLAWDHFLDAIKTGGPKLITQIETAAPNAQLAFLGRDTQALADLFDAFYTSIGQRGRVIQIAVSGPTLANFNDRQIVEYMKNFGINIDSPEHMKPVVLIDTVSSGTNINGVLISGRQGRRIIQALYSEWLNSGRPIREITKNIRMIGLRVVTFDNNSEDNKYRYDDIKKSDTILEENVRRMSEQAISGRQFGTELVVPLVTDSSKKINESGYDHYTGTWNDKFKPPSLEKEGNVYKVVPGALKNVELRKSVLWFQHQIIDIVNSKTFRKDIKARFEESGLNLEVSVDQKLISCRQVYK